MEAIDEFRFACHRQYFAYDGYISGRSRAYEDLKQELDPANPGRIAVGTAYPNAPQLLGKSTIAWISQEELLAGLKEGGEFENQHAKALVVFLYQLWEVQYRKKIADVLSIKKNQVNCTLMGDLRQVRHIILHDNSVVTRENVEKFKMLPQIWDLHPGELRITQKMIHAMMEQINGLLVDVASAGSPTVETRSVPIHMGLTSPK